MTSNLIRWGGLAATVAGVLYFVGYAGMAELLRPTIGNLGGHVVLGAAGVVTLPALVGVLAADAGRSSLLGAAGYVLAFVGAAVFSVANLAEAVWFAEFGEGLFGVGLIVLSRVRYETVEKTSEGMKPRLIERPCPTGLIVTTTRTRLHPENETRLISLTVTDTQDQTRDIMAALASDTEGERPDMESWHALQSWLEGAERRVKIPYAKKLAESIPPVAVRLRRDFGALLNLIRAHALLHQANSRWRCPSSPTASTEAPRAWG